jgi:hypothetical protein
MSMSETSGKSKIELQIGDKSGGAEKSLTISGNVPDLHNDPSKIHQLLDLLELPQGTEVRVVTTASSVIVR